MTREYQDSAGSTQKFTDAQFLVFVNRILAFAVALVVIMLRRKGSNISFIIKKCVILLFKFPTREFRNFKY